LRGFKISSYFITKLKEFANSPEEKTPGKSLDNFCLKIASLPGNLAFAKNLFSVKES
jgi:hypothetical protein